MFTHLQAKAYLIEHLREDVGHHRAARYARIGEHFDEFDANLSRGGEKEFDTLHIALNFWDSWQDARNHDWKYYSGISREDWPSLAESLIADIAAGKEVRNEILLRHFQFKK